MLLSNEAFFRTLSRIKITNNIKNNNTILDTKSENTNSKINPHSKNNLASTSWQTNLPPLNPDALNEFIIQNFASGQQEQNRSIHVNLLLANLFQSNKVTTFSKDANMSNSRVKTKTLTSNNNNKNNDEVCSANQLTGVNSDEEENMSTDNILRDFLQQSGVGDLKSNLDVFIRQIEDQKSSQAELNAQFKSIQRALNSISAVRLYFFNQSNLKNHA